MEDRVIENERPDTDLLTKDFAYDLPEELIAQHPAPERDMSRLMVVDRASGEIRHLLFRDVADFINPSDVLVVNDSKVIPARLCGYGEPPRTAATEILLLREREKNVWECLAKPGKRAKIGAGFVFGGGILQGRVEDIKDDGNRIVAFEYDENKYKSIYEALCDTGITPTPPYIKEELKEKDRYQTVYARREGSSAAPTAGLHFTEALLEKIRRKGTAIVPVMLHVGLGTFRPVKKDRIADHVMHTEHILVTEENAAEINKRRQNGGKIICVGTTSARTLESVADENGEIHPFSGETGIFIYPGYRFKAVDALITNFHLPESTLLMLVSAFYDREKILEAYKIAIREKYGFFSFGDAMLIL